MLLRKSSRTNVKAAEINVSSFCLSLSLRFFLCCIVDDKGTCAIRVLCGLSDIIYYLTQCLQCNKQSVNGRCCSCDHYLALWYVLPGMEESITQFFLLFLVVLFILSSSLYFMEFYDVPGLGLGAGNPVLRTNTSCGSHLHRDLSLEWEMDVYPAVLLGEAPGPTGA